MLYTQREALSTQNMDNSTWPGEPPLHLCRHTAPEQSSSHFLHLKMPSASQTQLHAPHHYSCKHRRPNPTFCQLLSKMAFSRRQRGHHWKFSFFLASTFLAPQPHLGSHRLTRKNHQDGRVYLKICRIYSNSLTGYSHLRLLYNNYKTSKKPTDLKLRPRS